MYQIKINKFQSGHYVQS